MEKLWKMAIVLGGLVTFGVFVFWRLYDKWLSASLFSRHGWLIAHVGTPLIEKHLQGTDTASVLDEQAEGASLPEVEPADAPASDTGRDGGLWVRMTIPLG